MTKKKTFSSRLPQLRRKPTGNPLWVKGHTHPGPGRPRGSKDKYSREVKQALLDAVEHIGEQIADAEAAEREKQGLPLDTYQLHGIAKYLEWVARDYPAVISALLARIMPAQTETTTEVKHTYHSMEEIANRLRELGLEPKRIYDTYPLIEAKKQLN
jgi:hypothetical protein